MTETGYSYFLFGTRKRYYIAMLLTIFTDAEVKNLFEEIIRFNCCILRTIKNKTNCHEKIIFQVVHSFFNCGINCRMCIAFGWSGIGSSRVFTRTVPRFYNSVQFYREPVFGYGNLCVPEQRGMVRLRIFTGNYVFLWWWWSRLAGEKKIIYLTEVSNN